MNPNVDLRQLAVRRTAGSAPEPARRRHLVSRFLLPGAVLVGFAVLAGWAARDSLLPARPVTVVPVLATRAEVRQEGAALFQAAGWVEPRPTPVLVTGLAEGVVERLLVVEGQEVKADEPVARLIDAEARLALDGAEADRQLREADLASARATLECARVHATHPIHLEAALAEADAVLAKTRTELAALPFQLKASEARQRLARLDLDAKTAAASALPALTLARTQAEMDVATATAEEQRARKAALEGEVEALTRKRDALRKQLSLKAEEVRHLAEAAANEKAAAARLRQAQVAEQTARLRLERMTVRSPCAGRVLGLVARPGMRLMGLASGSHQESSTVITLYDPAQLQVRADVRLEDVPHVQPGQPVRIETAAVTAGPLDGEVLFATSQADIQKNTLQVKVAIKAPPPVLKPDMLVQVTFLAVAVPGAREAAADRLRLFVPRQLVESAADGARVWVADQAASLARRRAVKLGPGGGDLVEVVEGLTAADKLIAVLEGLRDGERIRVTGEDGALGTAAGVGTAGKRLPRLVPPDAGTRAHH
jgi:multidrug efflux pump subunit AcrA (membrane-fusion protein)